MANATIVDAFVVTLGLDPRQYQQQTKQFRKDLANTRDEADTMSKNIEASGKRAASYFRQVKNEVLGLLLVFAGASSIKGWVVDTVAGAAATGRLAANLGIATEELSSWQEAVKGVGGDAKDADAALSAMVASYQSLQLTGTTGHDADFNALGISQSDLKNPVQALLKFAEASERLSKPEFVARMQQIGIPQSVINLLEKGRKGVEDNVESFRKLGVITQRDAEAAQKLQEQLERLEAAFNAKLRPILTSIIGQFADWVAKGDNLNTVLTVGEGLLVAFGVAALGALGPLGLLAGAIALIALNWDKVKKAAQDAWDYIHSTWVKATGGSDENAEESFDYKEENGKVVQYQNGQATGRIFKNDPNGKGLKQIAGPLPPHSKIRDGVTLPSAHSTADASVSGLYNTLLAKYGKERADGIWAGIGAESSWNPNSVNPKSGAYGLGQWLGSRKKELFRRYGKNPTAAQQMEFLIYELEGGDKGGASVLAQTTKGGAADAYLRNFMRPGGGLGGDLSRASQILGGRVMPQAANNNTVTNNVGPITIYTPGTDGKAIARDFGAALGQKNVVIQANGGMTR